ncbi:IS110 family transposase [Streptomyces ipomoeae]|uniref:IS110 family transposase n=1 Tax=Streptomyces ipomoeae TaxID=103232 RepID=UPI001146EC37|nr:transposase [Streptomyces ipomoeae]MDX2935524.1 transposase [Streptomyces ipomoeae]TQE18351.1 IS110 family transposase [Streptomyces ipomoeae]
MDVIEEWCGDADLGKADVKVCIRVPGTGKRTRYEVRTFSTMNDGLLELRDRLVENRIARIDMEATASYWKPLFYLLEATEGIEPWLLNARHIKSVPGRKTDVKDCQWICKLVEHGLVRPSFIMSRFATAGHLASWAGVCPGNKESAGKRLSGRTRHGDTWLKTALFMAGAGAAHSKTTYLGAQFRRLVPHRGAKRATLAIGHSILVAAWHILHDLVPYRDLGPDHFTNRLGEERQTRRLIAQLAALGMDVTIASREQSV